MSEQQQKLNYNIIQYLNSLRAQEGVDASNIETAVSILEATLNVEDTPENFSTLSIFPTNLLDVFNAGLVSQKVLTFNETLASVESDPAYSAFVEAVSKRGYFDNAEVGSVEYLQRQAKLIAKFRERALQAESRAEQAEKKAEEKKAEGNTALTAKNFDLAIAAYTEAIELSPEGPNSHIYYSNRAAAYTQLRDYEQALLDCETAISLKPDYTKAVSRLATCYYFMERYEEAVATYEKLQELEPTNATVKDELRKAKKKLESKQRVPATPAVQPAAGAPDFSALAGLMGGGGDAGGVPPGLAGMMGNPAMKAAMDKAGGPAGIANLMKDPNMMAMAQKMMQNPALMQQAMSMMGGGGGGDMPDMSALAGLMGGGGGGAGASPSAPSSSSSSSSRKGKAPFRGFEE